eukprot:344275-Alexandrium_andersonii.AAC.1
MDDLVEAKNQVDTFLARSTFWKEFGVLSMAALKKKYSQADAAKEMLNIEGYKEAVENLEKKVKQATAMQQAKSSLA